MSFSSTTELTGVLPCDALIQAGLRKRLLLPTEPSYDARIQSYWSLNSQQHPFCILQPQDTNEVTKAMTALLGAEAAGDWHIAIRAGGHSIVGANNIDNGVTIDLVHLNQVTYDKDTNLASIGPGLKWMDVYAKLEQYDVLVAGGRDGDVGVGGFLLGGGSTFYMGTQGFGCDDIKNYEVVLTNGTIINANEKRNRDLWLALKGGGSNFGIVTRYDMEALPNEKLAYRLRTINITEASRISSALVKFTDNYEYYQEDALVVFLMHNATAGIDETIIGTIQVNTGGKINDTGFKELDKIPDLTPSRYERWYLACIPTIFPSVIHRTNSSHVNRMAGFTLTFANDKRVLKKAVEMHEEFVQDLKKRLHANQFVTEFFFQPMPSMFSQISNQKGGNMIESDLKERNALLWTAGVTVNTNQQDRAFAQSLLNIMIAKLKKYSQSCGASNDLVYMNYAASHQDPLGSYGSANVKFLKDVARLYDPKGLFQTRFPGGFKISRVGS
ncbi:FAD binding domain-containing protein [Penicillium hetheringtonii]|uniref:FAD binding domain-containing protein n=1 Tax=Penicillium hetheringtonii TaxID=911720 RepID=A0AAD6GN02_9EURO|nr:FAD binding domain-containing protein [Penicillium hetheringtonii]